MQIVLLIILIIVLLVIILMWVYYFYHYYLWLKKSRGVPYTGSLQQHLHLIKKTGTLYHNRKRIDLGCWDWKALRYFAKHLKIKSWIWYDVNKYAIQSGNIQNKIYWSNNLSYFHQNFIQKPASIDRAQTEIVYLYLFPHIMKDITQILEERTKKWTIIICNTFPLEQVGKITLTKEIKQNNKTRIFIYEKN
jgi:hypothetical protein